MAEITGYKSFNSSMTNRYKEKFEVGKVYSITGPLQFGTSGNGYHFCLNLEDTLRYVDAMNEPVNIAKITSLGEISAEITDEYNGYYDMYVARTIRIDKILTREEIVNSYLNLPEHRTKRFIENFRLTQEEIKMFKEHYQTNLNILCAICYSQENYKDIYKVPLRDRKIKLKSYYKEYK